MCCPWEWMHEVYRDRKKTNIQENLILKLRSSLNQRKRLWQLHKYKCRGWQRNNFFKKAMLLLVWRNRRIDMNWRSFAGRQFCLLWATSAQHDGLLCFRLSLLIWYGESWWRPPSPSPSPRPSSTSSPASSSSASSSSSSWWGSPTATGAVVIGAAAAAASAAQTVSRESQKSRSTQTISTGRFSTWRQGKRETASFRPPQDGKHPVTRLFKWHFNVF